MKVSHLIRNSFLTGMCLGLMTGCAWLEDWPPKGSEMARKSAPKPPVAEEATTSADEKWINSGDEAAAPPVAAAPVAAVSAAAPKGVIVGDAADDRIARLEQSVEQMSNDLKMMMPALTKMAAAQGDMQRTLNNVEPAAGGSGMTTNAPVPLAAQNNGAPQPGTVAWYEEQERKKRGNAPANQNNYQPQMAAQTPPPAAPPPAYQAYQPPVQQQQPPQYMQQQPYQAAPPAQPSYQQASYGGASGAAVTNVRFGEHPDKTRMVLDASANVSFSYNVDNAENILMISLPGAGWQGIPQMMVSNSPLVASYNVVPDNQGGQQLIIQLKRPVHVQWAQALAPTGPQGHRVVFDLVPL